MGMGIQSKKVIKKEQGKDSLMKLAMLTLFTGVRNRNNLYIQ